MEGADVQPHIHLTKAQTRPVVIVVGDPARAKLIASLCEKSEELAYNREYRCSELTPILLFLFTTSFSIRPIYYAQRIY